MCYGWMGLNCSYLELPKWALHGLAGCGKTACPVGTEGLALVTGLFYSLIVALLLLPKNLGLIMMVKRSVKIGV